MISYAQNAEDAVLARLFNAQKEGFYVDVGAGHPVNDSVTKYFYDRGWTGLNIEPMQQMYELLCADRPRDINVHAAVSDRNQDVTLFEAPEGNLGGSTIEPAVAVEQEKATGETFTPRPVEAITLTALFDRHGVEAIDFLKIDAEGHEAAIILSTDWSVIRPRVLVVEAVEPVAGDPSHGRWEHALLAAGYVCTLFDGLNRFYAQAEDEEALAALSTPANAFDEIEPWRWVSQLEGAKAHIANLEEARSRAEQWAEVLSSKLLETVPRRSRAAGALQRWFRRREP